MIKIHNEEHIEATLDFLHVMTLAFDEIKSGSSINDVSCKYNIHKDILCGVMAMATDVMNTGVINLNHNIELSEKSVKFTRKLIGILYPEYKDNVMVNNQMINDVKEILDHFKFNDIDLDILTMLTLNEVPSVTIDKKYNKYNGYSKRRYERFIRMIRINIGKGIIPPII